MADGKGQGARSDLQELANKVKDGATDYDVAMENPGAFCRYYRGFSALRSVMDAHAPKLRDPLDVTVIVTGTGIGKTHWCFEHYPALYRVKYPEASGHAWWWDGYVSQETVLFDEFDGSQVSLVKMLQYLDRYPITVQSHNGGLIPVKYTRVFLTTNVHPALWYSTVVMDAAFIGQKAALERRISRVIEADTRMELQAKLAAVFDPPPPELLEGPQPSPAPSN